ncbi:Zinc finger, CHY-type [Penicillium camemberti]|uniref:Zinc finger, CHY-type n=1 Tax=Penicillium camemberti (strain FM 013) TaxID=1429867 RepID=A0A0G4P0X0_PENC3|nr:Zinc finger, CHY-type [Penicillium camemberti]
MSGFISSLLIQIGIRSPLPPQPSSLPNDDQATFHLNEPTNPSSDSDHKLVSQPGQDREQKSNCGDAGAGSLHSLPFFTTLPKEMDGRNLQPEDTRSVTHNTPRSIQNIAATTDGSFDPTHEIDVTVQDNSLNSQASHLSEALHSHNEPEQAASAISIDEPRRSLDNAFDPGGLAHSLLPADDGMGVLRSKIIAIRDLRLTNVEKARMVHGLMTEGYNTSRELPSAPGIGVFSTPSSPRSLGLPTSPEIPRASEINASRPGSPYSESGLLYESTFNLTPEDLQPTFAPKAETESPELETGDEDGDTEDQEEITLGCVHYHRNVKLECHTCKKWYTCRFCHDEVEDHSLIRRDTEHMLCMLCGHAQPAAQNCRQCSEQTAQYYCEICKLWDNDSKKSIYHCSDCGICRIGQGLGKDFFHCQTCSVCLPMCIENTHRCIERSTQCDCPICGDYMFTSPDTVVVMRCGHSIHHKCLSEYSKSSYRCPLCSKTITNMESTFRNLDRTIESQPMPDEFNDTKGLIYCNDCGSKSVVKYHWLGLRCDLCESYNTAQLRILHGDMSSQPEEDAGEDVLPRPRSSSLIENDDSMSSSMAALNVNNTSIPHSQLRVPMSPEPARRLSSYNITRGRAVSPVVSNYFGLPTERESEKPSSMPFFGGPSRGENEDYGALNFLSKKLTYRYGLFGGETKSTENVLEAKNEEDGESSDAAESDGSHGTEDDDEEEEEDQDHIQIFGHQ